MKWKDVMKLQTYMPQAGFETTTPQTNTTNTITLMSLATSFILRSDRLEALP
jgi:hypothetical protein